MQKKKNFDDPWCKILQLPAIEKAIEMGLKVVALDINPDAVGFNIWESSRSY